MTRLGKRRRLGQLRRRGQLGQRHGRGGEEVDGEGAGGGDGEAADVSELGSGGGEKDLAAKVVGERGGEEVMLMAIEDGVNAMRGGDQFGTGAERCVITQVRKQYHVIGSVRTGIIHGALDTRGRVVAVEVVNDIAKAVLEVSGRGGEEGRGGGDSDEGDASATVGLCGIRSKE